MSHLAIDLGSTNQKSEGILFTPDTVTIQRIAFTTNRTELLRIIEKHKVATVIIEMCRPALWVHRLLTDLGLTVLVANTNAEAFRLSGKRTKTDRTDAERLRFLYINGDLKTVTMLSEQSRAVRQLLSVRAEIVKNRSAVKSTIRHLLDTVGLTLKTGKSGWTKKVISMLHEWSETAPHEVPSGPWQTQLTIQLRLLSLYHEEAERLTREIDAISEASDYAQHLQTVPGIGLITSVATQASLDDPHRFRTSKQVSKYSGFNPVPYESGKMKRCIGISRMSWSLLRGYLVESCCVGIFKCKDPWFVLQYERLYNKTSCKKKALCAVARKLYVKCWQMLRTGESWTSVTKDSLQHAQSSA